MSRHTRMLVGFCGLILFAEGRRQSSRSPTGTPPPVTPPLGTEADEALPLCVKEVEKGLTIDDTALAAKGLVRVSIPAVCQQREALERHVAENHACYGRFSAEMKDKLVVLVEVRVCNGEKDPKDIPTLNVDLDSGEHTGVKVEIMGESEMARQDEEGTPGVEVAHEHLTLEGGEHAINFKLDELAVEAAKKGDVSSEAGDNKEKTAIIDLDVEHDTDVKVTLHGSKDEEQVRRKHEENRFLRVIDKEVEAGMYKRAEAHGNRRQSFAGTGGYGGNNQHQAYVNRRQSFAGTGGHGGNYQQQTTSSIGGYGNHQDQARGDQWRFYDSHGRLYHQQQASGHQGQSFGGTHHSGRYHHQQVRRSSVVGRTSLTSSSNYPQAQSRPSLFYEQ